MVKKRILLAISLLVIALIFFYYPTEKRKIKKTIRELESWLERKEDLNLIGIAIKSKKAKDFFKNECDINFKDKWQRTFSIEEIEKGYYQIMTRFSYLKVMFKDLDIQINENGTAYVQSAILIESKGANVEDLTSVNEVILTMEKIEKKWKIKELKIEEILEK